ncbi:MAG: cytochrome-c oxidase [Pseudomonadales bacterium]|nr:cytochrome-c oxidase [Pseudomonadales bacterium]
MRFVNTLAEKPWLNPDDGQASANYMVQDQASINLFGLRLLLAVIFVVFALFVGAYNMRMTYGDVNDLPMHWRLILNTSILIFSSLILHIAYTGMDKALASKQAVEIQLQRRIKCLYLIAGMTALMFVVAQITLCQQLMNLGYSLAANPANSFFYLITGLHALHIIGGVIYWCYCYRLCWQTDSWKTTETRQALHHQMRLCANYWHGLLLIWLMLLSLLLMT